MKATMAVSGLIMVAFLLLHMLGNLKIFFGPSDFDGYAGWLRTIGEPVLHRTWFLWAQRVVLTAALVLHVVSAARLSRRDLAARPESYRRSLRWQANYATRTMRYGGVIIALFLVWHLLDLTVGVANPHFEAGRPYQNVVRDFQVWWINLIYIVAILLVGLHIQHGFTSAGRSLGRNIPAWVGSTLAVVITVGFVAVPIGVMSGLVR
jgi:succinate dehydrogenase / fumarate reductase cytochrome b subunit